MKKYYLRLTALAVLLALLLTGCSPLEIDVPQTMTVHATFYPIYALAAMVAQDVPDLTLCCLVQPQNGCLRSYTLSDWDAALLLRSANAVLAGGSGLESFDSTLEQTESAGIARAELLYGLELYSMGGDDEESHFSGSNPHLYMSMDGAVQIVERIAASLSAFDPKYADQYEANAQASIHQLGALKEELTSLLASWRGEKVVLMNEALIYVAEDYGFDAVTWIQRESGESLRGTDLDNCLTAIRESGAKIVLIERQAPQTLVDALTGAGFTVAQLDVLSMRGTSDGAQGYFDAQRENAAALAAAFQAANDRSEE